MHEDLRRETKLRLLTIAAFALLIAACGGGKEAQSWSIVHQGLPGALTSVWGASATDIWAVGGDPKDGSGSTVMHYDGSDWERLSPGTSGNLWWVFGFQDGPVYMGGENGLILRYDDGMFRRMTTPGTAIVYGIWGTSPEDLWAVGGNVIRGAFARRYDGVSWSKAAGFPSDLALSQSLFKVWGRGKNDVWMVGTGGVVLRYDGSRFERTQSGTDSHLITLHADGERTAAVGGLGRGVIIENDGTGWEDVTPSRSPQVLGVWLAGETGYAVGVEGAVLRSQGGKWEKVDTGIDMQEALHAVWVDPEGGVWAVGGQVLAPPLVDGVMIYRSPVAATDS